MVEIIMGFVQTAFHTTHWLSKYNSKKKNRIGILV